MAVANFTPKELGAAYVAHSEVSKMLMKSVFLAVGIRSPQLLGEDIGDGHFALLYHDKTSLFSRLV
jgi:hypothetical protein